MCPSSNITSGIPKAPTQPLKLVQIRPRSSVTNLSWLGESSCWSLRQTRGKADFTQKIAKAQSGSESPGGSSS